MTSLTDIELNALLLAINLSIHSYLAEYGTYFDYIYDYGFRTNEGFNSERYIDIDSTSATFQPQKGNNVRYIATPDIPITLYNAIIASPQVQIPFSPIQQNYLFKKFCKLGRIYILNKPETIHLYRHNRMKQMRIAGATDVEIGDYFGEVDTETVGEYIDAVPEYN